MEIIYLEHYNEMTKNQVEPLPAIERPVASDIDNAGIDLRAAIEQTIVLEPGVDVVIPSGIKVHIGSSSLHNAVPGFGLYGMIVPRSGLGFKHYLRLANTAGIIDANYQGEIMIKVRNEGQDVLEINRGDRICQIVFQLYAKGVEFEEVTEFSNDTTRGADGFGSSGVS